MNTPFYHDALSPIHRLHPAVKLITTFGLILLVSLAPVNAIMVYVAFFAVVMVIALVSLLEPWRVVLRSALILPFAGAAAVLVVTGPAPYLEGPIAISQPGLMRFTAIVCKSSIAVQLGTVLLATTRFDEIIAGLAWLRFPPLLTALVAFTYRYLFVLIDEVGRLNRARQARTVGQLPLWLRIQTTGRMVGSLLVRGLERSERVYRAMLARGGASPTSTRLQAPAPAEWVAAGALLAIGCGLLIL